MLSVATTDRMQELVVLHEQITLRLYSLVMSQFQFDITSVTDKNRVLYTVTSKPVKTQQKARATRWHINNMSMERPHTPRVPMVESEYLGLTIPSHAPNIAPKYIMQKTVRNDTIGIGNYFL